jgi:hypothetical protein
MAVSVAISTKELERQAKLVFEGKTYKLFLAAKGALTVDSTRAAWEAVEASGGGYAAATGTIPAGTYNTGNGRYEMPAISGTFTATGGGFSYDTVCLVIDGSAYLHSALTESPSITLAAGQSKSYTLTLVQDD